jgi:hypothetical protein
VIFCAVALKAEPWDKAWSILVLLPVIQEVEVKVALID